MEKDAAAEIESLKKEILDLKKVKEIDALKNELQTLKAKATRTLEDEIKLKVRTDAAVVAESLPDTLTPFKGKGDTSVWLTQTRAMLPTKLRNALDRAIEASRIAPIWDGLGSEEAALCEVQDKTL